MQKFLWLLSVFVVLSTPVRAEENFGTLPAAAAEMQPVLPSCSDENLKEQVKEKVMDYFEKNPRLSIVERRRQQLLLRNLKNFSEIPVAEFDKKENFTVADKILMTKVNDGLEDKDLRLCRSDVRGRVQPVYLFLHPENYQIIVDILNFRPGQSANSDFFIIFE